MTDMEVHEVSIAKEPQEESPLITRVGAELIGSFLIFFSIYVAGMLITPLLNVNMTFTVIVAGLAYGLVTMLFGGISGGQFNPAVTIAAMLSMKTRLLDGVLYIVAQLLGAIGAGYLMPLIIPTSSSLSLKMLLPYVVNGIDQGSIATSILKSTGTSIGIKTAIVVEVLASIIVVAAAMMTIDEKGKPEEAHALIMGAAYGLGTSFTYLITGSGMNPARSTGIALVAFRQGLSFDPVSQLWIFWLCPILAAALVTIVMVVNEMFSKPQTSDLPSEEIIEAIDAIEGEDDQSVADDDNGLFVSIDETRVEETVETTGVADNGNVVGNDQASHAEREDSQGVSEAEAPQTSQDAVNGATMKPEAEANRPDSGEQGFDQGSQDKASADKQ